MLAGSGRLNAGQYLRQWPDQCRLNAGQYRRQWPGIGLMHVTPTHSRVNGELQYCSFETCGEFTGNIHMNSPQESYPWGIPLGESDSLPQANW